ncbi:uncharacterized protein LOC112351405 [Selaginella moellendorffii]|uniref:uncharacterized protein LOC112351405 n=1 Tax=Selaginella moellendorffii TaxID=88036 RepID=UPI000D1C649D|nr:uncharacterized protein LOC112351405 [Selaginella moellendorffii]|eukprot:XP_024545057.1 uncharacterized protein LOC112351405 [Selaginella moellendorffii]
MALQAGVSTVKVLILVGAGLTGTFLVNNGRLTDFISDLSKVISKHLEDGDVSAKVSDKTTELAGQLMRLRQELMQLAASKDVTFINGSSGSGSGANISSLAMPAVVVGAAGYGYFRWRGWRLTDFLYVTKRHMANAVSEVSKQFDQVSAVLAATRRHLSMRIEDVSKALEDSAEVQGVIKNQVLDMRSDVVKCGGDVQVVQQMVEGLESKIGEVQSKQDFANRGILLLCQYVQDLEHGRPGLLESKRKLDLLQQAPKPPLLKSGSPSSSSLASSSKSSSSASSLASTSSGLKELQQISEKLQGDAPRTLRPTFSVSFGSSFASR